MVRRRVVAVMGSLLLAAAMLASTASPAQATVFSNTTGFAIPVTFTTMGPAGLYPSPIVVSGLTGTITDVNVSLFGLNHSFPPDLEFLLVGPGGQNVIIISGAGSGIPVGGLNLVFDDSAPATLPSNSQLVDGTFKPTNFAGFSGPGPAPAGPFGATLSVFNATSPNGTWALFAYDAVSGGSGSLSNGWSLDITTNGPTISSFTPTSGPAGTSVVISGTNFTGATDVKFNGTAVAALTVNSATKITATVPVGATTGPIAVTTPAATATSTTNFTVSLATITSFSPSSGPVGTSVVITGTNLSGATAVKFNGTPVTTFTVESSTQITATVPAGAGTGPISVIAPAGTATSATKFGVTHGRSVSLTINGQKAKGTVNVTDGFAACGSGVPVSVQHAENGTWKTVGATLTHSNGSYKLLALHNSGKFRTVAKRTKLSSGDICLKDISPVTHT